MRLLWWQGGVHIEPETDSELQALDVLLRGLHVIETSEQVPSRPIRPLDIHHKEPIVLVDVLPEVVPKMDG
jgi:hypothetical protein